MPRSKRDTKFRISILENFIQEAKHTITEEIKYSHSKITRDKKRESLLALQLLCEKAGYGEFFKEVDSGKQ